MRATLYLGGLLVLSALLAVLLAGCGGGGDTQTMLPGSLTFDQSTQTLIFTPSAELAGQLRVGDVGANFTPAQPTQPSMQAVPFIAANNGTQWKLKVDSQDDFPTVANGSYVGDYSVAVYAYDQSKGLQHFAPVTVHMSLVINRTTPPVTPPAPPWSN